MVTSNTSQGKSVSDDRTGEKCANGQSNTNSSVFYLNHNNGGVSDRTCKVPAGKGLFIPVMPMEMSDKEAPGATGEELKLVKRRIRTALTVYISKEITK